MPIYEFKCKRCGKEFEEIVFSSDLEKGLACPSCGDRNTSRLMSSFSCSSTSSGGGASSSAHSCSSHRGFS